MSSGKQNDGERWVDCIATLGSNIERERYLPEAVRLIRRHRDVVLVAVSRFFESPSVGTSQDAPDFYNAAVLMSTKLRPKELRTELRRLESLLGRERTDDPHAPRTIDLDLVYYGDVVRDYADWSLPDQAALKDPYVAVSIADVAPDWVHPETGQTAYDIAASIDTRSVRLVPGFTLSSPHATRGPEDWDSRVELYAPRFEELVRHQLFEIGEDPDREGLIRTPLRVAKALDFLTSGYGTSLEEVVNNAIFDAEGAEEMVLVKDIEFYSICEHHMLPFFGKAAIAYLPDERIIGLSKLARIVDLFARRLQVQERMTNQIAEAVSKVLEPHGIAVVVEGRHFCMMMRGVQKQDSSTVTSSMLGTFKEDARTRAELLDLVTS